MICGQMQDTNKGIEVPSVKDILCRQSRKKYQEDASVYSKSSSGRQSIRTINIRFE